MICLGTYHSDVPSLDIVETEHQSRGRETKQSQRRGVSELAVLHWEGGLYKLVSFSRYSSRVCSRDRHVEAAEREREQQGQMVPHVLQSESGHRH
jgi:hypothetical protein